MDTYHLLKSLHIFGVVIFLGNIIITGWWKTMADRTKDPVIVAFAQRQVTLTDYIFTVGGVVLILGTGLGNAIIHDMDYLTIKWLVWGEALFAVSGIIWVLVLIPVQIKLDRMSKHFSKGQEIPEQYWKLSRIWMIFGTLATIVPIASIYWMVYKPI